MLINHTTGNMRLLFEIKGQMKQQVYLHLKTAYNDYFSLN